ncbi:hypothetical protein HaLaN_26774 [Haematococcus lacustris]|uniref:Uncharacterized protein n=1 Tax=Haematococcus lacustris TaxID=44745 RepID=A0A6A0A6W3_HAELA|nr:hypothetical protein HaLaN_26774 [Haematococcus lacustris]
MHAPCLPAWLRWVARRPRGCPLRVAQLSKQHAALRSGWLARRCALLVEPAAKPQLSRQRAMHTEVLHCPTAPHQAYYVPGARCQQTNSASKPAAAPRGQGQHEELLHPLPAARAPHAHPSAHNGPADAARVVSGTHALVSHGTVNSIGPGTRSKKRLLGPSTVGSLVEQQGLGVYADREVSADRMRQHPACNCTSVGCHLSRRLPGAFSGQGTTRATHGHASVSHQRMYRHSVCFCLRLVSGTTPLSRCLAVPHGRMFGILAWQVCICTSAGPLFGAGRRAPGWLERGVSIPSSHRVCVPKTHGLAHDQEDSACTPVQAPSPSYADPARPPHAWPYARLLRRLGLCTRSEEVSARGPASQAHSQPPLRPDKRGKKVGTASPVQNAQEAEAAPLSSSNGLTNASIGNGRLAAGSRAAVNTATGSQSPPTHPSAQRLPATETNGKKTNKRVAGTQLVSPARAGTRSSQRLRTSAMANGKPQPPEASALYAATKTAESSMAGGNNPSQQQGHDSCQDQQPGPMIDPGTDGGAGSHKWLVQPELGNVVSPLPLTPSSHNGWPTPSCPNGVSR